MYRENYMFWSDVGTKRIYRAKMDGTQMTTLVQTDITTPGKLIKYYYFYLYYYSCIII